MALTEPYYRSELSLSEDDEEDAYVELEAFSEDEGLQRDTTAVQLAAGRDIQGIPWELTQYDRDSYREVRNRGYVSYFNLEAEVRQAAPAIAAEAVKHPPGAGEEFYAFYRNWRQVRSSIVHFQLRNLLWATSAHDVYTVHENRVQHWNSATQRTDTVMDVSGGVTGAAAPGLGAVQLCTLCVKEGLVAAGGFGGELVVHRIGALEKFACSMRVTASDNGITNAIEVAGGALGGGGGGGEGGGGGALRVLCSNNDDAVRAFDAATFQLVSQYRLPWAVNCTAAQAGGGRLLATVGDDPTALVYDASCAASTSSDSGVPLRPVATLRGHHDFSFAIAWHPTEAHLLATGSQDRTTRVWDLRHTARSLAVLQAHIGAVRSLRFSPDGRFLAAAEPADYVTLYNCSTGSSTCSTSTAPSFSGEAGGEAPQQQQQNPQYQPYRQRQVIDLFGELAGIAFTPRGDRLLAAVSDVHYSSVLQFDAVGGGGPTSCTWQHLL